MSKKLVIIAAVLAVVAAGVASATQVPTSAATFLRVFNDCPFSTVNATNNYPGSVVISDAKYFCGGGWANRHAWRFSQDGLTAQEFANNNGFRFSAVVTATGTGAGEFGIGISPWWSQTVDGVFNLRTTDGEVACFGGRLPFYSFTGSQGVHYQMGQTILLTIEYLPNGLSETEPGTIVYTYDDGTSVYTSGALSFDMGNPNEPYGLWGILEEATAGGNFQFFIGQGPEDGWMQVEWASITFTDLGDAVATESETWGAVKSLYR
jgi:hypothetical protein